MWAPGPVWTGAENFASTRISFLFSLCTLSVIVCPIILCFAFCPYCTTHNTNIHAPDGIRTRNPNKRSATDPSLKPLGHCDRTGFDLRTVQPVASCYTDWATPAHQIRTQYSINQLVATNVDWCAINGRVHSVTESGIEVMTYVQAAGACQDTKEIIALVSAEII